MRRSRAKVSFRGKAVTIACTDKARPERFYRDLLGPELLPGDGYGCPRSRLGALTFGLLPNVSEPCPAKFPPGAADGRQGQHRLGTPFFPGLTGCSCLLCLSSSRKP